MELEAEVAAARRGHEVEMGELRAISKAVLDKAESYNLSLENLIQEHGHNNAKVLILGSDGVFDNLFLDEIVEICNEILPAPTANHFSPMPAQYLSQAAQRIVKESHAKSDCVNGQFLDTPIGKGGKVDDTSVVVGEIIEWTEAHTQIWSEVRRNRRWKDVISCGGMQCGVATRHTCSCEADDDDKSRFRGCSTWAP
eukprot:g18180.t1